MGIPQITIKMGRARGLMQGIDENLMSLAYSPDCQNFDVSEGDLSTRKGITKFISIPVAIEDTTYGVGKTHKLMRLESVSSNITGLATNGIPIIGVYFPNDGSPAVQWYAYHKADAEAESAIWNLITSNGVTAAMTDFDLGYTRYIEYKIENTPYLIAVGGQYPVKIHMDYGTDPDYEYHMLAEKLSDDAPQYAAFVTLHRERVWLGGHINGLSGAYVDGVNDMHYSNAFEPTDWTTGGETGFQTVETFDGDYIRAAANIFDDVLMFKKNTAHKITGDLPSEYGVDVVYSVQGTIYPDSVCADGNRCFFAGDDGIYQYNGVTGEAILTNEIKDVFRSITNPKCVVLNNKLYIWDRQTVAGIAAYTGKCIVFDTILKTLTIIYTNNMLDVMVSDGKVLFTDGNYIYQL